MSKHSSSPPRAAAASGRSAVRLKVLGPWPGWDLARAGRLERADGSATEVLLVPARAVLHAPESAGLSALREEARRVAGTRESGLLRLKQVAEVDGAPLVVFEAEAGLRPLSGLVRTAPTSGPRAAMPLRAALELLSSVAVSAGVALDADLDPVPALVPARVLLDADGHPRLLGVHGVRGAAPAVSFALGGLLLASLLGETPPTTPAQARRGMIRLLSSNTPRPPDAVVDLLRAALTDEPSERPAPAGLGAALGALARGQPSASLQSWQADRRATRMPETSEDPPRAPRALGLATGPLPDMLGEAPPTESADDADSAGVDEVPLVGAAAPRRRPRPRRPEGTRPMSQPAGGAGREGGTQPLVDEATAEETEEVPRPGTSAAGGVPDPGPRALTERTLSTPPPGTPVPAVGPPVSSPPVSSPPAARTPAGVSPLGEQGPLGRVSLAGPGLAAGGSGHAADGDEDLDLDAPDRGPRPLLWGAAVLLLVLVGGWWAAGRPGMPGAEQPSVSSEVRDLEPVPTAAVPTLDGPETMQDGTPGTTTGSPPPARADPSLSQETRSPEKRSPEKRSPESRPPEKRPPEAPTAAAPEPPPEGREPVENLRGTTRAPEPVTAAGSSPAEIEPRIAPRSAAPAAASEPLEEGEPAVSAARSEAPSAGGDGPTRAVISVPVSTAPSEIEPEPSSLAASSSSGPSSSGPSSSGPSNTAPPAATTRSAAPAPAEPPPWALVFVAADERIERIEVTCHGGRTGAGARRVAIPDAVPGPCRVEARSEALGRLVAHVSVAGTAEYECFTGGARSCR